MTKIHNLKRASNASRQSGARSKENVKAKAKNISTEELALNKYYNDVLFSNVIRCFYCGSNKTEKESSKLQEDQFVEKPSAITFRRFQKFWKCNSCTDDKKMFKFPESCGIDLTCEDIGDRLRYCPAQSFDPENVLVDADSRLSKKITLMYPVQMECLNLYNHVPFPKIMDIEILLYKGTPFSKRKIEALYINQVGKYQRKKLYGDQYLGKVKSSESRVLSSVKKLNSDSQIPGSHKWMENKDSELSRMCHQLGQLNCQVEVTIPLESPEVLASILVQKGLVVSANMEGGGTLENSRTYFVHTGDNNKDIF